jgi:hypothetical protein
MKAILEYELPEDQHEHAYALAGVDALLAIDDLRNEIRSFLKYTTGSFSQFSAERYNEKTNTFEQFKADACPHTLDRVAEVLAEIVEARRLPELV